MLSPQLREDLEAIFELFGKEPYMGYKSNVAHQKKALRSKRNLIKGMGLGGNLQYKDMMKRAKQATLTPDDHRTIETIR